MSLCCDTNFKKPKPSIIATVFMAFLPSPTAFKDNFFIRATFYLLREGKEVQNLKKKKKRLL